MIENRDFLMVLLAVPLDDYVLIGLSVEQMSFFLDRGDFFYFGRENNGNSELVRPHIIGLSSLCLGFSDLGHLEEFVDFNILRWGFSFLILYLALLSGQERVVVFIRLFGFGIILVPMNNILIFRLFSQGAHARRIGLNPFCVLFVQGRAMSGPIAYAHVVRIAKA